MSVRFLHTADWQLGMTRHFLKDEAQARFTTDRFDAICELGRVAKHECCEFVVVCGDVFETNQVDRKTVARACDALTSIAVPVFLLPGNHDAFDAGSVFRSPTFLAKVPEHVSVLGDCVPREVRPGVEVVGAPWTSKRPLVDLVDAAASALVPRPGVLRVLVGHGAVDTLSPDQNNPALVSLARAEAALAAGRYHFLALGDRHSLTRVDQAGRVWYSGSPVATDFDEVHPGQALVVELSEDSVHTAPHQIGSWRFVDQKFDVMNHADIDAFERWLGALEAKTRTVVRLALRGSLTLQQNARLHEVITHSRDLFASVELWARNTDLVVVPEDADFAELALSGFAEDAVVKLRGMAAGATAEAATARDALALLVRLCGGRA